MKKIQLGAAIVGIALTLTSLGACGGSESSGSSSIEVMTGLSKDTPQLKALEGVTKDFERKNPSINIKLLPASSNNENDIKVRLAGHNPPDIWGTHGWSRDRYANFLEPMQNRPWAKRMKPIGNDVFKTKNGEFYTLPVDIQVSGVMYNKTVIDKLGIDVKALTNWDAFEQACDKVKAAGITPVLLNVDADGDLADFTLPGFYTNKDLKNLQNGKFDTKVYQQFTDMAKKWKDANYFRPDYTSATQDDNARSMASDQVAFYFRANGNAQMMESLNPNVKLGLFPVPTKIGAPYFSVGEEMAFGVSKTSKHKQDALKYIDFLAEPAQMNKLVESTLNDSALTGVKPALGQFQTDYDYWTKQKKTRTVPFFDRKYLPSGMWNPLNKTTDGVISGQISPAEGAQQMKTAFDNLYGQKKS